MTINQQITAAVSKAKTVSITWADDFLYKESNGDIPTKEIQLWLLGQWIWILLDYQIYNFSEDGSAISPDYVCVTEEGILLLIGKINNLTC